MIIQGLLWSDMHMVVDRFLLDVHFNEEGSTLVNYKSNECDLQFNFLNVVSHLRGLFN